MTAFKKAVLFIHRWLGFMSGLVVFIVSITGCLFCFQDEIQDAMHSYRHVEAQERPYLQPSELYKLAEKQVPGGKAGMVTYVGKDRPAMIRVTDSKKALHTLYLDPYTGKFLYDEDLRTNFFIIVEFIHLYLLLPVKIGKMVVGISVIIFVVLMVTGLVLWWPKRKTDRKRSFTIKWNGRWRRINYDLHNVLGFYATAIAIVLAITGLSFSFEWVNNGLYKAANLGTTYAAEKKEYRSDSLNKGKNFELVPIDAGYAYMRRQSSGAQMYLLYEGAGSEGVLYGTAYAKTLHFSGSDLYSFDKYTGKVLSYLPNSKKSAGMQLNNMNYDIHVGQIAGLPGKIIAFLVSLISASLPVTGFIIWLGKRKKKPRHKKLRESGHKRSHAHLMASKGKTDIQ
jgi:uncharacterized iron-regulated membrane protein